MEGIILAKIHGEWNGVRMALLRLMRLSRKGIYAVYVPIRTSSCWVVFSIGTILEVVTQRLYITYRTFMLFVGAHLFYVAIFGTLASTYGQ